MSRIFVEFFFVSQHRKTLHGNPSVMCFGKFSVAYEFMDKKRGGGGVSKFSIENFLSHSTETFRRRTFLCCVSENFWKRKSLWIRGKGKYHDFPSKNFCLRVPKKFVGEPFRVSLIAGIEKFSAKRVMSRIFVEFFFVSQHRKTLHGNPSVMCFGKFSVAYEFMDKKRGGGGVSKFSIENFLSHSTETFRRRTFLCCVSENFWKRKSIWIRGWGEVSRFPSKIFVSQCRKVP